MPNTKQKESQVVGITKQIGVRIQKDAMSKTENDTLMLKGFFTSDNKDMHGDIITRSATERAIEAYRQWGNIRRMHTPDPVGKMRGIGTADGLAWNEISIEVIDPKTIFEVENELLVALSVGAAIQWEDIEWLEDGGMLINDYLLGEISLVDHPGNYDAVLSSDKAVGASVELLINRFGVDAVGQTVLKIAEETDMADNTDLEKEVVGEEIVETAEIEDEVVEDEDVETTKESTEETETEIEETVEETEEEIEEENTEEEETEEVETELSVDETDDSIDERLTRIENLLTTLVEKEVVEEVETEDETVEEEQDTAEEDGAEEETEVATDAHKAVVPATEDVEVEETEEEVPVRKSLRDALNARFNVQ